VYFEEVEHLIADTERLPKSPVSGHEESPQIVKIPGRPMFARA
jgi:hypothetical protein